MRDPTLVCGVPIDDLTLDETIDRVSDLVTRGRATGRSHQIVTVNVDFLVNSLADDNLLTLLQRADLAVPDGMPVVWGSRLLGSPLRERVAGADLVPALAERCAQAGHSLYLYGAGEGVAAQAAELLARRHPTLKVQGEAGPFFDDPRDMDPAALEHIRDVAPDVLLVALGHPKQEKWIDAHRGSLRVPVMMGVGGSLDFLTGNKRRAPLWMQRTGVEWCHRAWQEPRRLAYRYARDLVRFGPRLARDVALFRSSPASEGQPCLVERVGAATVIRARGRLRLDAATLGWEEEQWLRPRPGLRMVIDFSEQNSLDHRELRTLVGLAKRLADEGGELTLMSVRPQLALQLLRLRLYGFLPTASGPLLADGPPQAETAPDGAPLRELQLTPEVTHA